MSGPLTIGVDLGGTKMVAGLVSPDGTITDTTTVARPRTAEAMIEQPFGLVESLITDDVVAIGMGVAGLVDNDGRLAWGPNVTGVDIPFRSMATERFGLPVAVDNDANFWAVAESHLGAAAAYDHAVILTLGTGIGGGIIIDREVYRGHGFAGELGHIIVDPQGLPCTCGHRGCWETRVSGRRLDDLARTIVDEHPNGPVAVEAGVEPVLGRHLHQAALDGNVDAIAAYAEVGEWLGRGLLTLTVVLDPEVFVIGGSVADAGDLLLEPARQAFRESLEGADHRAIPPIVRRTLGADGGAVGAGIAAHRLVAT